MTDYKATLNLPKTAFPMKANLAQREPVLLKQWEDLNIYGKIQEKTKAYPRFMLHDGPPYANGRPHLGTALNKTLKDIIIKSKTLSGFNAPFVPGWDCHGLPIELNVEKKVGKPGHKVTKQQFRQKCREYARKQVDIQREDFKRLGVFANWDQPYLTLNTKYEADAVRALGKVINNAHLHRGQKPVHWCTACASALAEAEVEYKDKASPAVDVGFLASDPVAVFTAFAVKAQVAKVLFPIWTTTPWTLPANEAVCLHEKLHYALVSCQILGETTHLVLAKDLVDSVMQRYGIDDYEVHGNVAGSALENIQLQHPFLERIVPVILGEHVTTDAGTGNVHTAPAHGQDDYIVAGRYGLPVNNPVDSRSCFVEGTPIVSGLHVFKANEPIIVTLADKGALLHHEAIHHSYPHCWRHKTPLIFRATPQWFISMDQNHLRDMGLKAVENTEWLPSWGKARIGKMIEGRPDWCISRQRTWGIPIPLFVHRETLEIHPETPELIEKIAAQIEKDGIDAWFEGDTKALLGNDADDYDKVTDILDVWFDSGVTHYCVLEQRDELNVPADLYLEGSDQHRGWFQSSLLTSLAIRNEAPYKKVLTHGYVVDGDGRKMSKSIGNVIFPADVVKTLGADVLRLWASSTDHAGDINVSDEILKRASDAYRRIRNTARFLLSNLSDFNPETDQVPIHEMVELDQWAIQHVQSLQQKITEAYDNYHFQTIYQVIHNFCSVEMGSFYLDIIKDRQYTTKQSGSARRSAQTAMYHILEALVRWLAPILSFTAEEIWEHMPGEREESVFLTQWYDAFPQGLQVSNDYWSWVMMLRDEVNKILESHRKAGEIGSALDAEVMLFGDEVMIEKLSHLGDELRFALITSDVKVLPTAQENGKAEETEIDGLTVQVNVSKHNKCERCWQHRDDVGVIDAHPGLCGRCVSNVDGAGEIRRFA